MESEKPRVLVASPTYAGMRYCIERFLNRMKSLTYPNYDILLVENSDNEDFFNELKQEEGLVILRYNPSEDNKLKRLIGSRNKIIDYALEKGYDYILMMDCDVIPPENVIEELLSHNKDIISSIYLNYFTQNNKQTLLPVAWTAPTEEEFLKLKQKYNFPETIKTRFDLIRQLTKEEADTDKLIEVCHPSAGSMLLKKQVFEKVRYGFSDKYTTDEMVFIKEARKEGFKMYVYTKIKCNHLISGKFEKDSQGNLKHPLFKE
ncbi:glycosyltransferase [Nanoarchaeota archaeon]